MRLAVLALLLAACGPGFEKGVAITAPQDLAVGTRAWVGMPRGETRRWVTELAGIAKIDGLFGGVGGIGFRSSPTGTGVRVEGAFGMAGRRITNDLDNRNGLAPYVELQFGADWWLGANAPALTTSILGTAWLNGDEIEPTIGLLVGLVWK